MNRAYGKDLRMCDTTILPTTKADRYSTIKTIMPTLSDVACNRLIQREIRPPNTIIYLLLLCYPNRLYYVRLHHRDVRKFQVQCSKGYLWNVLVVVNIENKPPKVLAAWVVQKIHSTNVQSVFNISDLAPYGFLFQRMEGWATKYTNYTSVRHELPPRN